MHLRFPRRALPLIGLLVLGAGSGCGRSDDPPRGPGPAGKAAEPPGVVLLCIDTLRADAPQSTADGRERMPALAAFARGATSFADASSPASSTPPSVASILCGLDTL